MQPSGGVSRDEGSPRTQALLQGAGCPGRGDWNKEKKIGSEPQRPPSSLEGRKWGPLGLTASGHCPPHPLPTQRLKILKKELAITFLPHNHPEKGVFRLGWFLLPEKSAGKERVPY